MGIEQRRLDGVRLAAAGFTNLTRDHLDYHGDMAAYRAAKLRLFDTVLEAGGTAVPMPTWRRRRWRRCDGLAARRGFALLTVGEAGETIRLTAQRPLPDGQALEFTAFGARHALHLPLPGRFQADNALLASGAGRGQRHGAGLGRRRCCRASPACAGGWSWRRRCRMAPPSMSTTPIRRTRWSGC